MLFGEKTKLNRIMPKAKFMKLAGLSTNVRNELQNNVERLILANVLNILSSWLPVPTQDADEAVPQLGVILLWVTPLWVVQDQHLSGNSKNDIKF